MLRTDEIFAYEGTFGASLITVNPSRVNAESVVPTAPFLEINTASACLIAAVPVIFPVFVTAASRVDAELVDGRAFLLVQYLNFVPLLHSSFLLELLR